VRELGPPREVDVCGDLVVQHYPREVNGRDYERSEELAGLGGMKRASQYLASNPEAVTAAQRVAAESGQREKLSEIHVDDRQILDNAAGATDVSPVHTAECRTSARAGDPDDQPETWVSSGTSAGVRISPLDCGVLPAVHNTHDDPEHPDDQELEGTGALRGVDAGAMSGFDEYEEKHYAKALATCADAAQYLGGVQPVLSDVRVVTKIRVGHTKRRILRGRKKAGSTRSSQRAERTTLPRVSDAVNSIMELSAAKPLDGFRSDFGVLDFPDAFRLIPLHRREREHFVARLGKKHYVLLRTAQDSRGAPLAWSRCDTLTLHKADSGTRVTFTVQVTQSTADKVTEITTEIRRLNVVPLS